MRARVRAVTLDAGSTLIHWCAPPAERFELLCRRAGIPLPAGAGVEAARAGLRFQGRYGAPPGGGAEARAWWAAVNAESLRAAGVDGDLAVLGQRIHAAAQGVGAAFVPDPDVPAVLEALRTRGLALAVVSNWDGDLAPRLGAMGLARHFAFIADSTVVGVAKPDPAIDHLTCRSIGVPPESCLHVGDRPETDVAVALAAGAIPVLYDPLEAWDGPEVRVTRLLDLLGVLDGLETGDPA